MEIRDYKTGDEIQILKLFYSAFGKPLSEAYWKWRFIDNPENKTMIKLIWDNNILAGHYAVSPLKLNVDGEVILTALSMTTMTHPNYAGRGLFTELAKNLYQDESKKNGLKAVWGFPNNNSHYAFIKNLKWKNLEQIPTFSISIDRVKESESSAISIATIFDNSHINAQLQTSSSYDIKVEKSINYLTWRYLKNPTNKYDIFEIKTAAISYYAVTKIFASFTEKNQFEVDILELAFSDNLELLLQLLNAIKKHYSKFKLFKINMWLPLNDKKHLTLEKIGFINTLPITYSGLHVLDDNYKQLEEQKKWQYSMGDSDVY